MRTIPCLATIAALLLAAPPVARACGGTFSESAQPVDQTGGNILFVLGPDEVEFHVQITYDRATAAEGFAWLIPTPTTPAFSIGSEGLFQELRRATAPIFEVTTSFDACGAESAGGASASTNASTNASGGGETDGGGGVDVVAEEIVGAFEVVVLAATSADEVLLWLADNGYKVPPDAASVLQLYLDEGSEIVAFKLKTEAGLDAVHPIILRFPSIEGCVPIRLTRIAAVDDLDLRIFALADARAIPTNFPHVLVNPLQIDWLDGASNYKAVVRAAVDAFKADGRAFVTEYAGTSDVVVRSAFHRGAWEPDAFVGLPAVEVIDVLSQQGGLVVCEWEAATCEFFHPLLVGLLATYLPVPQGVSAGAFYSDLPAHAALIDLAAWGDGSGFAADMEARIVAPGLHARALVDAWPYLTRLYTTISPDEMIEDPLFMTNPDLPEVSNHHRADMRVGCEGEAVVVLPDGREVHHVIGQEWPTFTAEMPYEEEIERTAPAGAPIPVVDNTALIDRLLAEWNGAAAAESGCGCVAGSPGGGPFGLALLGLLGLRRRRPRPT